MQIMQMSTAKHPPRNFCLPVSALLDLWLIVAGVYDMNAVDFATLETKYEIT